MVMKVRRVLAGLAVCCFFLPLGQCTHVGFETAQVREDGRLETADPPTVTDVFVPATVIVRAPVTLDGILVDVLLVSAFFWPLLTAAVEGRAKTDVVLELVNGAQLLASIGTLYLLYGVLRVFRDIQPAGYVAIATFAALFFLGLLDSARAVHSWIWRRRPGA